MDENIISSNIVFRGKNLYHVFWFCFCFLSALRPELVIRVGFAKRTYFGLSLQITDMMYPSMKPISGIREATKRTSGMKIIHIKSLKAMAARIDTMTVELIKMLRPTWRQK